MPRYEKDFYYIDRGKRLDDKLHTKILEDGDDAKAKKVSDQVARDVGLTDAEIEALSAPPQKTKGKPK